VQDYGQLRAFGSEGNDKPMKLSKNTAWFATGFTLLMILLFTPQGQEARSATGQAANQSKSKPIPAPAKQEAVKKAPPTLGFNHIKDVPPIIDEDAMLDEHRLEKELPGNQFVHDKRAMHETILMNEFMEGFKNSKECNGITFYLKTDKKPNFTVQISVMGHDDPKLGEQTWTWILAWPGDPGSAEGKAHGMGGMGNQLTAKLAARDVCMTVWDDVDPNHFKKPGGKIE
jgi:hypothetical protein